MAFGSSNHVHAQTEALLLFQDSIKPWNSMISLHSDNVIGSNSIDMGFLNENIFGGELSAIQIQTQIDRMKQVNRAGGYSSSQLLFTNFRDSLFGRPHWGLQAGMHANYTASANFQKDLFTLAYQGNRSNDSLQIGPMRGVFYAYQKFSVGVVNKKNWNSVSLGIVFGQSMRDLSVYGSALQTSALGDTLSLSYNGTFQRSDTTMSGIANGSGIGLALDAQYHLPMANEKGLISIALYDVGFAVWNSRSETYEFNGDNQWTGLETSQYLQVPFDSIDLPNFKDSIEYNYKRKSILKPLPTRIQFRYLHHLSSSSYYEFGMQLIPGTSALPRIHMGLGQQPFHNLIFTQSVSYGGFGRWGLGAGLQYLPCQSWFISLQTNHLGGFTMSSARSRHIQFTIAKIL
jgi:hypothetical protein